MESLTYHFFIAYERNKNPAWVSRGVKILRGVKHRNYYLLPLMNKPNNAISPDPSNRIDAGIGTKVPSICQ